MSKKRVSGAWVDDTPHIYNTSTDTFSTLPHEVIGDGTAISSYTIKGNMTQSGTPTPSNPIYPTECGDKTANLFDKDNDYYRTDASLNVNDRKWIIYSNSASVKIVCKPNTTYTISVPEELPLFRVAESNNKDILPTLQGSPITLVAALSDAKQFTFTTAADTECIIFQGSYSLRDTWHNYLMICEGSATLPYEPFGYKIPISLSQNTYNIYITEPLRKSLDGSNVYDTIESNGTLTRRVDANGDALATPTTEQVTVPTLTTTGTAEQFNVLTTLAPSEVSLTYHGWHEHSDTKFTTP